ncbi:MAG: HIT family protein [archaeon]
MDSGSCIFCKIVKGDIPSVKVWEDKEFLAILDNSPNSEGMALVMTKKHYDSYAFDMPDPVYKKYLLAAKKVAKMIEKGLQVHRVCLVMEGMGINHAHLKLYPLHGLDGKFKETWAPQRVYFKKYEGYISTQLGPQKSREELEAVAKKIRG